MVQAPGRIMIGFLSGSFDFFCRLTFPHRIQFVLMMILLLQAAVVAQPSSGGWTSIPNGRILSPSVPAGGADGFEIVQPGVSGVQFANTLTPERGLTNQIFFNGSGVALGDVDGDGLCDIYLCSIEGENALYRNLGNWKFESMPGASGAGLAGKFSTGATLVDIDGDGDLDLIVNTVGNGTWILLNDGKGHFHPEGGPLNVGHGGTSMAVADFDGNGTLDLYVTNYRTNTLRDMPNTRFQGHMVDGRPTVLQVNGRPTTEPDLIGRYTIGPNGGIIENGEPDVLFLNDGKGHFRAVSWTEGVFLDEEGKPLTKPPYDWGLSVMARDLNGDGFPDLYVCNDFDSPDRIWFNDGTGKFREAPKTAFRKTSLFSMGVDVADVDRDGRPDIFVADMLSPLRSVRMSRMSESAPQPYQPGRIDQRPQYMRNMLHWNRGDGTFAEIGFHAGIEASEWSWTPVFLDVDLDGYEDLLITNGHARDDVNIDNANRIGAIRSRNRLSDREILMLRKESPRIAPPNVAFRNRGNLTFENAGPAWNFSQPGISQGMAVADLDNDGDLDVVINNLDAPATILRNTCSRPRVSIRLKGLAPNTGGIGAKVVVKGGPVVQSQEWISGGRYLSSDDGMRVFAAGNVTNVLSVEVQWRSGKISRFDRIPANALCEFQESGAVEKAAAVARLPEVWFEDLTSVLQHRHVDEPYDDMERQSLLPWRLSSSGPSAVWSDLNNDGWDDLVIGTGKGGRTGVFLNDQKGGFKSWAGAPFEIDVSRDQTGWVGAVLQAGRSREFFSGSSNYEDGLTNGAAVFGWDLAAKSHSENFPGFPWASGPLALGDFDGDGSLELFVGGTGMGGEYPRSASSVICKWKQGAWVVDPVLSNPLASVGLVQSSLFTDLDNDGRPELVLATQWGPVRVFSFSSGKVMDRTESLGLAQRKGWWNSVVSADLDGDGRLDLVVGNWGSNSRYRASVEHPIRAYFKDFDGSGILQFVMTEWDSATRKEVPVRGRKALVKAIPLIAERNQSFDGYGTASVGELLGNALQDAGVAEVNFLESVVLLNRGGRFEMIPLPAAAQWSPVFGISAADFDGDGKMDLFLGQNIFSVDSECNQLDAGEGLMLRGDGRGRFVMIPSAESGLHIYGEQRSAAVSDFNQDGRVDLVVTQNSQETRLFANRSGHPGLRVRLTGSGNNPDAIGAWVRAMAGGKWSPAQELQAGSGYWSQNSLVLVFSQVTPVQEVEVTWPGGRLTRGQVPHGAREITVSLESGVRVTGP